MFAVFADLSQVLGPRGHQHADQCDLDCFQRLHKELPLSLEELEHVFDALDTDGNGFLTPEEFTTGFSKFGWVLGTQAPKAPCSCITYIPVPSNSFGLCPQSFFTLPLEVQSQRESRLLDSFHKPTLTVHTMASSVPTDCHCQGPHVGAQIRLASSGSCVRIFSPIFPTLIDKISKQRCVVTG